MENQEIKKKTISQKVNEAFEKMSEKEKDKLLRKYKAETILLSLLALTVLPIVVFFASTSNMENIYEYFIIFVVFLALSFIGSLIYTVKFMMSRKFFTKMSRNGRVKFIIKQYRLYSNEEPLSQYKDRYYVSDNASRGWIYLGIVCLLFVAVAGVYAVTLIEEIGGKVGASVFSLLLVVLSIYVWAKCLKRPKEKD